MALTPCPRCHRHVYDHNRVCPFCGAARILKAGALLLAGTGIVTLLSACYGPPQRTVDAMRSNSADDVANPMPSAKDPGNK